MDEANRRKQVGVLGSRNCGIFAHIFNKYQVDIIASAGRHELVYSTSLGRVQCDRALPVLGSGRYTSLPLF